MFLSRNKKNNVYPCKPQFYYMYIKVGFEGSKLYRHVIVMRVLIVFGGNVGFLPPCTKNKFLDHYLTKVPDNMRFFNQNVDIFLIFHENIYCLYSLDAPCQGASNKYPQHMFSLRNKKTISLIPTLI